jgi:hypothetical protein
LRHLPRLRPDDVVRHSAVQFHVLTIADQEPAKSGVRTV